MGRGTDAPMQYMHWGTLHYCMPHGQRVGFHRRMHVGQEGECQT